MDITVFLGLIIKFLPLLLIVGGVVVIYQCGRGEDN